MLVYLASASPRRRSLLIKLGLEVVCVPTHVREVEANNNELSAAEVACGNAIKKLYAASKTYSGSVILAADTVVTCEDKIYGKPRDLEEAALFLRELRGRMHEVVTAVAVVNDRGDIRCGMERSRVVFKNISDEGIRRYLSHVNTLDKAGGYALQEKADWLIDRVEGSVSNIIGLPLELTAAWVCWARGIAKNQLDHRSNPHKNGAPHSSKGRIVNKHEARAAK
jgi:septum formation protein